MSVVVRLHAIGLIEHETGAVIQLLDDVEAHAALLPHTLGGVDHAGRDDRTPNGVAPYIIPKAASRCLAFRGHYGNEHP